VIQRASGCGTQRKTGSHKAGTFLLFGGLFDLLPKIVEIIVATENVFDIVRVPFDR
jgi:hypothetical protein